MNIFAVKKYLTRKGYEVIPEAYSMKVKSENNVLVGVIDMNLNGYVGIPDFKQVHLTGRKPESINLTKQNLPTYVNMLKVKELSGMVSKKEEYFVDALAD